MTASIVRRVGPSVGTPLPAQLPPRPKHRQPPPRATTPWATAGALRPSVVDPFTLGTTKPDASNTGVPSGTSLTTTSGTVIQYSTAGATYSNLDIYAFVRISANDITFNNCRFRGIDTGYTNSGALVLVDSGVTGLTLNRCTIAADFPKYYTNGVYGGGFTLNRCDISRCTDGIRVARGSGSVLGCYVHDFFFTDLDNDQAGSNPPYWSHNDGIQFRPTSTGTWNVQGNNFEWYPYEGFTGAYDRTAVLRTGASGTAYPRSLVSTGSNFEGGGTGRLLWGAGITVSPDLGPVTGVTITQNWFEGGTACFQMNTTYPLNSAMNLGTISHNRFGRDQYSFNASSDDRYQIRYDGDAVVAGTTTNVWDDLPTVPVARRGTAFAVGFTSGIRLG